ncbi:MAG: flavodoxin family protein [Treponema sp.]|nr:flavodoxin family protein [Treponema sp.]
MNKKLLILQASPRKGGNVYRLAQELADSYTEKGFETEMIDVTSLHFHDCVACMKCRSSGKCIFNDDADDTGRKIEEADIIAVASPVWWGNMPGHLKSLFDRNVFRFMREGTHGIPKPILKGKKGILITACTTPFPFDRICGQTTGLKRAVNEIFKSSGIKLVKVISKSGTKSNIEK